VTDIVARSTDDDDALPQSITHSRDTIIIDGTIDQDYRFLDYRFEGGVEARMYLDDSWEVSITAPIEGLPPAPVMAYLQRRFAVIKQLGGPDGYRILWEKAGRLAMIKGAR
jgi:hypothetical protein